MRKLAQPGQRRVLIAMSQYAYDGETIAPEPHRRVRAGGPGGAAVTTLISDDEQLLRVAAQRAVERLG